MPNPCPTSPIPLPTPHSSSPDGHEVEDIGHPWAVAQEGADADLEHDGNHQDPVPVGEEGLRLADWGQTQTSHLKLGNRRDLGRLGVTVAGRCPKPVCDSVMAILSRSWPS